MEADCHLLLQDNAGSSATDPKTPVLLGIQKLRSRFPELLILCDVCLCAYTDHGHCGISLYSYSHCIFLQWNHNNMCKRNGI